MDEKLPVLDIHHLSIGITRPDGIYPAINDISFSIMQGETFALLGESGCGKTLTALSINQLLPSNAGYFEQSSIILEGQEILQLSEVRMRQLRGQKIGMVFQEPMTSLNPVLTIGRQIAETLKQHSKHLKKSRKETVIELLSAVGIPDAKERYQQYPHQLSGGMKQRVMIAMSIAAEPALLIADEPTTALDVTIQSQILQLLKKLQEKTRMGILLITHDLGVVHEIAHRVAVMYAGEIVELSDTPIFFNDPKHPYSKKLFEVIPQLKNRKQSLFAIPGNVPNLLEENIACTFANRCQFAWSDCHKIKPQLLQINDKQWVRCHLYDERFNLTAPFVLQKMEADNFPKKNLASVDHLLKIENLKVYFPILKGVLKRKVGDIKAVDDVSFELKAGKTLALVGESGCGKTTLGKAILRLIEPTGGRSYFNDINLSSLTTGQMQHLRKDLQFIFQDPYSSLDPRMRVIDLVAEGIKTLNINGSRHDLKKRIKQLLHEVGLVDNILYRYPHEFSGGQRQRLCIARALAVRPKLIICDEPTSALDLSVQAQILNLLRKLQNEFNLSYLFISHNISVVSYMADDIAVMYLGRIVEIGKAESILTSPKHPYTQALLSAVPILDEEGIQKIQLKGELPSPANPPSGCHFHTRCPFVMPQCKEKYPDLRKVGENQKVKCYLYP